MDKTALKKLNAFHVVFLIQNTMTGYGLLSLTKSMSSAGYNEWFFPIFFGIFANLTLIPMVMLAKRYPERDLYQINEKLFGKWVAKPLNFIILLYCLLFVGAVMDDYLRLLQSITLQDKSIIGPSFFLIVVIVYLVLGGIKSIARFNILSFFATAWMSYLVIWAFRRGYSTHLVPHIFLLNQKTIVTTFLNSYTSLLGYESILFFFPYIINQKKAFKHATIGIWLTILFYVVVSLTSVMYFSEWQLKNLPHPVLNLFGAVTLSFIERFENVGIAIWVFLIISTGAVYLWMAKKGFDSLLNKKKQRHLYYAVLLIIILFIKRFSVVLESFVYHRGILYIGLGVILWPIVLLVLHLIKKGKKDVMAK